MATAKLVGIGLVAGAFGALFGVGGGIVIVPLLVFLFAFDQRRASATSLGAILITAACALLRLRDRAGGLRRLAARLPIDLVGLLGLAAGVLAGLFGVGGGIVFVPALIFGLGLSQLHAEATSLLAILPTAIVGSWRQHRYGNIDLRAALTVGLASIIGVQAGVAAAESLPESQLRRLFGVLLLITSAQIAWRARRES